MYRDNTIEAMLSEISANIEEKEQSLKDEYKKLIRISSDFDDISEKFMSLERQTMPPEDRDEKVTNLVDRLSAQLDMIYGTDRDNSFIFEAAMAVMQENSSAAIMSRD